MFNDVLQLEDVEVAVADHVQKVMKPNFGASWEEVGPDNELEDTYALSTMKTLEGILVLQAIKSSLMCTFSVVQKFEYCRKLVIKLGEIFFVCRQI
jgi:hypothetical protein